MFGHFSEIIKDIMILETQDVGEINGFTNWSGIK